MTLRLITGSANAGKSGFAYARLREGVQAGRVSTLILPTRQDVERAREEFAAKTPQGVAIVTFPQFMEHLWELYGDGRRLVRPEQRAALLSAELAACPPEDLTVSPGLESIICQLSARCAEDPVAAVESDSIAAALAVVAGRLRSRLRESGLVERPEAVRFLTAKHIELGGPAVFNRFTDLDQWQRELVRSLAQHNDVVVTLTWKDDVPATEAARDLVQDLAAVANHMPVPEPADDTDTFEEFAGRLFTDRDPIPYEDCIAFAQASSAEGEAALAASLARQAIDDGTDPERIAIAFKDVSSRRRHLVTAFRAEGIRVDLAFDATLSQTGLGRAVRAVVAAAAGVGSAVDVSTFASSPYAGPVRSLASGFDKRLRSNRVDTGSVALKTLWSMSRDSVSARGTVDDLLRLARACASGLTGVDDAENWNDLASMLVRLAALARDTAASDPENQTDLRALSSLGAAVAEIVEVGTPLGAMQVLGAFENTRVSFGGSELPGTVKVLQVEALRSRRFDVVVLGGLTAAEFSSEHAEPLVAGLSARLGLPTGSDSSAVDRQLFYLAVSRARKRLVLLRQASSDRGEPIRPSAFWEESLARFGVGLDDDPASVGIEVRSLGVDDVAEGTPCITPGRRLMRAQALEGCSPQIPRRGVLSAEARERLARRDTVFSPTEIELWLGCPYTWFYQRVLRPRSMDTEVDGRILGTLSHDLLKRFYRGWCADGPRRVTEDTLPAALELFDAQIDPATEALGFRGARSLADDVALAGAVSKARAAIERDVSLATEFVPAEFEVTFGREEAFEFGGVQLRGQIDRVDVGASGVMVLDYKSGGTHSNWQSWLRNGRVQLWIYSAYARARWGAVSAAAYRPLSTNALMGFCPDGTQPAGFNSNAGITEAQFEEQMGLAAAEVARAAEGILAGDIAPRRSADACRYCDLAGVCAA